MREISLVNQINDKSCVHACIAMVTGKTVEELWDRYPEPLTAAKELVLLIESKIFIAPFRPQIGNWAWMQGIYFISVPSLNVDGVMHRVLVVADNDYTVFDPQRGREGKRFYHPDCMNSGSENPIKGYSEIDMLDFTALSDLRI